MSRKRFIIPVLLMTNSALCYAQDPWSLLHHPGHYDLPQSTPPAAEEHLTVTGVRKPHFGAFISPSPLHEFADGHTERTVRVLPGYNVKMVFGRDTDHDPTTGTYLHAFGDAYSDLNPLIRNNN